MPDPTMRDTLNGVFEQRMSDLSQQLVDGEISLQEWQVTMRQELRDVHALQLIAAADGDKANVSSDDWLKLGSELQKQYRYLERFAHGIQDGSVSPDAISARSEMYAGSGKSSYSRQATGAADLPAYPCDGSTACLGHCGCEWALNDDGTWSWVRGKADSCEDCIQREKDWSHYGVSVKSLMHGYSMKYNENHDELGRFDFASGGGSGGGTHSAPAKPTNGHNANPVTKNQPAAPSKVSSGTHKDKWKDKSEITSPSGFMTSDELKAKTGYGADEFIAASGLHEFSPSDNDAASVSPVFGDNGKLSKISVAYESRDGNVDIRREFHFDADGKPDYIKNDHFFIKQEQTGTGLGTKVLKSQVDNASSMGFKQIKTLAGKSAEMNGYYTWPRLGYDGKVNLKNYDVPQSLHKYGTVERVPPGMSPPTTRLEYRLSDIMRTKEGRDFWKKNGKEMEMSFDLGSKSRSQKILNAYIKEKAKQHANA